MKEHAWEKPRAENMKGSMRYILQRGQESSGIEQEIVGGAPMNGGCLAMRQEELPIMRTHLINRERKGKMERRREVGEEKDPLGTPAE